jgi:hypothetical protein
MKRRIKLTGPEARWLNAWSRSARRYNPSDRTYMMPEHRYDSFSYLRVGSVVDLTDNMIFIMRKELGLLPGEPSFPKWWNVSPISLPG